MKSKTIIFGIVITTIALSAFGLMSKQQDIKAEEEKLATVNAVDTNIQAFNIEFPRINNQKRVNKVGYLVKGNYKRPITKEQLENANSLDDIIADYPSKWINDYSSVEIYTSYNGKDRKVVGSNDILSEEQKKALHSANLGTDISISVYYKIRNSVTNILDDKQMNIFMTLVPEVEAEYIGGYDAMMTYFEEYGGEISANRLEMLKASSVLFTVNEKGDIEDVKLAKATGDAEIDKLVIDLIDNMPKWKPAQNSDGTTVKQQFEFVLGMDGC